MKRRTILLFLLIFLFCSGCSKAEDFVNIKPLTDFHMLDNGNVEIVWLENGRYKTIIVGPNSVYPHEGENEIIETLVDGYFQRFIYLNEEDYECFEKEQIIKED